MKSIIKSQKIKFGTWLNFSNKSKTEWLNFFIKLSEAGITDFFINAKIDQLEYLIQIKKDININIHGWIWTFNRPNDDIAEKNIDWYSVNKNGENSFHFRPYVDYYQWLSPFSDGARKYIKNNILKLSKIKGLASVHLDYVRYCDVFLPITLQEKYNLKQEDVMPEYDFGYHESARVRFKKLYDVDPLDIKTTDLNNNWINFRLNAITELVNELKIIANNNSTKLSAAVFPYPEMAKKMVLQDWSNWELDMVCPMNYHHFYNKEIPWIGESVALGVKEIKSSCEYLSGLFIGSLKGTDLQKAVEESLKNGADGVSFFSAEGLSNNHLKIIKSFQ